MGICDTVAQWRSMLVAELCVGIVHVDEAPYGVHSLVPVLPSKTRD